jgi:transposase
MPSETLARSVLLPELKLCYVAFRGTGLSIYTCEKESQAEVCPKCATLSHAGYDRREISVKDAPLRDKAVLLKIRKRRFWCKPCGKPFTEPVPGISKGARTTLRLRRALLWACENFVDLKRVERTYRVSPGFVFKALYQQLEIERKRKLNYPWPKTIGIDEHSFRRVKGRTEFASILVDYSNRRVYEVAEGKTTEALKAQLSGIAGRENVKNVILDLCDPFKNFAREHFPNAKLVADKFHVLRLITPALIKKRYEITGTRADARARRLLTMSSHKLDHWDRQALWQYLETYPELQELYRYKEILHRFYRTKGLNRASSALTMITDRMARSLLPEIKTLRRTLMKWREEILAYFETGLTNGRTEGYNNLAKLVQKRAFGYKSFRNYRLRLLAACA